MTADAGAPARDFQTVDYEVSERIATITIDNPPSRNGFNGTMRDDLIAAARRADEDDAVRAVILTGRGKFFCPGADLSGGGSTFDFKSSTHAGDPRSTDSAGTAAARWPSRSHRCASPSSARSTARPWESGRR